MITIPSPTISNYVPSPIHQHHQMNHFWLWHCWAFNNGSIGVWIVFLITAPFWPRESCFSHNIGLKMTWNHSSIQHLHNSQQPISLTSFHPQTCVHHLLSFLSVSSDNLGFGLVALPASSLWWYTPWYPWLPPKEKSQVHVCQSHNSYW